MVYGMLQTVIVVILGISVRMIEWENQSSRYLHYISNSMLIFLFSQTRNEDGLIYIDVELPKKTTPNKQKSVIHGEEDRTIYADIAYGKVGEQPPEKEGESQ